MSTAEPLFTRRDSVMRMIYEAEKQAPLPHFSHLIKNCGDGNFQLKSNFQPLLDVVAVDSDLAITNDNFTVD